MRKTLALTFAALLLSALAGRADEGCSQDPALGQILVPPAPCFDMEARYDGPTRRYPHGVLGDDVEYTKIVVTAGRTTITKSSTTTRLFEDLAPRLANVDSKPGPEVIVVETDEQGGATLTIYKPKGFGGSRPSLGWLAGTQPIGQRFRWLAPAGIADFNGDGQNDIAYVETPHLGKVLRFVTLRNGRLEELASGAGFSNHRIGEAFISGGVRDCGAGPQVITANADWSKVVAAQISDGQVTFSEVGPFAGPESFTAALACATR